MTQTPIAVELIGVSKSFPGVVANSKVNIKVAKGSVHAIVGENGAGKSTLMKILYGMQKPDEGQISISGQSKVFSSPSDAIAAGVGMVHQHFMLAENLTVLENILLGNEFKKGLRIDFATAEKTISEIANRYGLNVPLHSYVSELGVGDRQRIEILKVLYRGARILILDEPTAVLVPHEVDELFDAVKDLTAEQITVIFISHKLDEVLRISDEITVMRAGKTVAAVNLHNEKVSASELALLMVGSELPKAATKDVKPSQEIVLEVTDLTVTAENGNAIVNHLDLKIHAGEILGIAGVEGNGQVQFLEALLGISKSTGKINFCGENIADWSTRKRREHGIGFIPEDRTRQALLLDAPLWENRMLGHQTQSPSSTGFWLTPKKAKADTARIISEYDVRTPNIEVFAGALSGGNQQKLIVGREMSGAPKLLIAAHPTRGVDVGAQAAIWAQLQAASASGLAVLLISADLDELIELSDSLKVILRGKLVAEFDPAKVSAKELGTAMTGAVA